MAITLCRKFDGEIISVDSRQVYKGMNVGTGKFLGVPSSVPISSSTLRSGKEREGVVTHLFDVISPDDQLNAFEFANLAWEKIEQIWSGDKVPFLVGGTGFYLDVILGKQELANVGADLILRQRLEKLTAAELVGRLKRISPERRLRIDVHNRYRLVRAIEVAEAGIKNQESRVKNKRPRGLRYLVIGLTAPNGYLYQIADERVDSMMKVGLLTEVKDLAEKYGWAAPGLKTVGYREFGPYFSGEVNLAEVVQRLKFNTHAYIRRQKTYFKKSGVTEWFDVTLPGFEERVENEVKSFLR